MFLCHEVKFSYLMQALYIHEMIDTCSRPSALLYYSLMAAQFEQTIQFSPIINVRNAGYGKPIKSQTLCDMWLVISGTGIVTIIFQQNNQTFSSRLTGVNMWDYDMGMEEIRRFSLGCGVETGNLLKWFDLSNKVDLQVHVKKLKGPSCTYREGECISVLVVVRKYLLFCCYYFS